MSFLDHNSLASLLELAISKRSLLLGRITHARLVKTLESLPSFLSNHLVNMYSKLDHPNYAFTVLTQSPTRSVVTWTSLISGNVQNGHFTSALLHFSFMLGENVLPNDFTFPCIFKACGSLRSPISGQQVHSLAIKYGYTADVFVGCSIFDMYCKTNLKNDARKMFVEIPQKNVTIWNAFITNSVLDGSTQDAVDGFISLRRAGEEPNSITCCAFLNACSDMSDLSLGKQLHGFVIKAGSDSNISICNGLVDFYGKCRQVVSAMVVFNNISKPNDVSWISMIAVYVQNDEDEKGFILFTKARLCGIEPTDFMLSSVLSACAGLSGLELGRSVHGVAVKACVDSNIYVGSSLVDMYGKCGCIIDAEKAFAEMPERNLISWNALIGGYSHQGDACSALNALEKMSNDIAPNYVTLVCVLSACSRAGWVEEGLRLFDTMWERYCIVPRPEHYACVTDLMGRAGLIDKACEFINAMPIRPTISIWGALLGACRMYRRPDIGKRAADKLFELDPHDSGNHVLLSNMFAAAGRWEEATEVRKEMKDVGIKKGPGYSWVTIKNENHVFQAKDTFYSQNSEIQATLLRLSKQMKAMGYVPDTFFALYNLEEEEKETELFYHSEKLALAFCLQNVPPGIPIRITKNLRVCGDCHTFFKFVSGSLCREILVRDNNRFHHFKGGICSCRDYW